ncbi:DUF7472 family protein [Natrialba sp. SSL1]|uniref:DUF7472 family protein n=1 Tax=Natrialba sp. SSL1 TaxID=1869245 RepID=UPI0008F83C58|nr:hypothetical protein [Natrialba sp. SSL1]OIB55613.1 hypothetical protein BBD46_04750 [Natrialba sp. SSL1]
MLERERLIELVVAVSSVLLMLGVMASIGTNYGGDDGILTPDGAQLLVGAIIGFVFLLTIVGIALAFVLNDPEDGLESDDDNVETDTPDAV